MQNTPAIWLAPLDMAVPIIFICYRRDDTIGNAGRLFDRLAERFGREHVYRDIDTIAAGQDFVVTVQEQITRSDVVLVLIGPRWLRATDEDDQWRLADANDLVRVEITTALKGNIRVIPVLLHGATMPKTKDLPNELAALALRNAIEIRDTSFDADLAQLFAILDRTWRRRFIRAIARRPIFAVTMVLLVVLGGLWVYQDTALTSGRARTKLSQMGIAYDAETFVERAQKNDVDAIKLFLRAGIAPDAETGRGRTALMESAAQGHITLVRMLAERGANVDTALPLAGAYGQKDVVVFLLGRQPGRAAISSAMVNALINGADADLVRMLLDKGADPNFEARDLRRGANAEPALIEAVIIPRVDLVQLLLSRGAHVNARGVRGRTALQAATSLFSERYDAKAQQDQIEIVKVLLNNGADLEARGGDYWQVTPLMLAIDKQRGQIALLLVEQGADVNAQSAFVGRNRPGRSALMLAAEKDMSDVVQALLAKGADVNYRNELGETALHAAARRPAGRRNAEVAQVLLTAGVEVNAQNNKGETALMLAAGTNGSAAKDDFVEALLRSGAGIRSQ